MTLTERFARRARQARTLIERDGVGPVAARLSAEADAVAAPASRCQCGQTTCLLSTRATRPSHHVPLPWIPGTPLTINWVMTPPAGGSGSALPPSVSSAPSRQRARLPALLLRHALGRPCVAGGGDAPLVARGPCRSRRARVRRDAGRPRHLCATSWQTAYLVHRDPSLGHRLYLVQDFEPDFYRRAARLLWPRRPTGSASTA